MEKDGNIINLPWYMTMFIDVKKPSGHVDMSYLADCSHRQTCGVPVNRFAPYPYTIFRLWD